jgi:hypothetical protein
MCVKTVVDNSRALHRISFNQSPFPTQALIEKCTIRFATSVKGPELGMSSRFSTIRRF